MCYIVEVTQYCVGCTFSILKYIMDIIRIAACVGICAIASYFIKQYSNGCECDSKADLKGKVIIVTGANTGIGKETALELVKRREKKLHILINNAGLLSPVKTKTVDGFERTFGVNHLGPFLLTNLLLDMIKKSAPSRIVTVSSQGHNWPFIYATLNFTDLMCEETAYSWFPAYSRSKLANILFSAELAERLRGTGVTTYSLHPGDIATDIARSILIINSFPFKQILEALSWPFMKDIHHGAQTQICCAVSEKLAMDSGKYYSDCAERLPSENAQNMEDARKLWEISAKLVGL